MITIEINGTDRTSSVVFNSLRKSDNLNQEVDNLTFKVRKYGTLTYVPEIGHEVVVDDGTNTIFGGVIVKVKEKVKAANILEYDVTCNDYSQYLKRRLVTERYTNQTAYYIINDIITNYTTGFTVNNVVTGPTLTSFAVNRLTIAETIQKLADALSYVWYVDYNQDIHFFPKNTESAPFNITDTSGNYIYDSLEIIEDITQIKNSVLVQGGEEESALTRTEYLSGDGTRVQFPLINKFSSVPTVVVGTFTQTVGVEFIDDDNDYDCMWNFNEKYLRFTSGNTPPSGTNNITATQKYLFPIVVRVPAPSSIATYGTYEFAITDKSIASQDEAIDRALAELQSYQNEIYEGEFRTYESGLRSGQVININSTQRSKNIDVLIQSVDMVMRDPNGEYFEYRVSFATLKSIGIIEYLQRQLRDREIIEDDQETLLNYITLTDDTVTMTDSLAAPVVSTGPYLYDDGVNWGYGVYG